MPTTNRRDRTTIRINSGQMYIKDGVTDFENLGEEISVKLERKGDKVAVTFMRGYKMNVPGAQECTMSGTLAQSDAVIKKRLDELVNKTVKVIIYNGTAGGKRQAYYFPQVTFGANFSIEFSGNKHQELGFDADVLPQDSNPSCTPSTDFPSEMGFTGASPVVSSNIFYVVVDESVI